MSMRRFSLAVFLILWALCVGYALYYYPKLPDEVASHFGAGGEPDGWMSKTSFITFYLVFTGFMALMFLGMSFGMSKIPVSLFNLPNKDYWLSAERKQETFDFMFWYFLWFGSATLLLLLDILYQSFQVHLGKAETLPHFMLSLGLYLGFAGVWCVGLFIKFMRKGKSQQTHAEI